jgi:hypothetical protein
VLSVGKKFTTEQKMSGRWNQAVASFFPTPKRLKLHFDCKFGGKMCQISGLRRMDNQGETAKPMVLGGIGNLESCLMPAGNETAEI